MRARAAAVAQAPQAAGGGGIWNLEDQPEVNAQLEPGNVVYIFNDIATLGRLSETHSGCFPGPSPYPSSGLRPGQKHGLLLSSPVTESVSSQSKPIRVLPQVEEVFCSGDKSGDDFEDIAAP